MKSPPPYGLDWTDRWLRAVARETGREDIVEDVISAERKRIEPELNKIRAELEGKQFMYMPGNSFFPITYQT